MSIIGQFRREGEGFAGRINTLALRDAAVKFVATGRTSGRGPDFIVQLGDSEVGAAWKANDGGGALLNVKLDDPTWAGPLNVRLMAAEGGVLPLTWIRRDPEKADKPAAESQAQASPSGGSSSSSGSP